LSELKIVFVHIFQKFLNIYRPEKKYMRG